MRKRNIFALVIASMALALGVGAGLKANKEVKVADALSEGETLYFKASSDWNGITDNTDTFLWMYCWGGDAGHNVRLNQVSGQLYSCSVPNCTDLKFTRGDANDPKWWDESVEIKLTSFTGGNNYVELSSGWGSNVGLGNYKEYRPEKTAGTAYLRGSWTGGWADFTHQMTVEGNVCTINNVLLSADEQIKVVKINNDNFVDWYDASSLSGNSGAEFVSPNVTIKTTGRYNISVNTNTKAYTVNVYEDVDLNAAISFCDDFKESMSKYCPIRGTEDDKGTSKLASEWSAFATRYSSSLSQTARDYLLEGENSSVEKITDFAERYDHILADYKTLLSSYDFLNRLSNLSIAKNEYNVEYHNTALIIVIVSTISLVALGGFFFIKRKKDN